MHLTKPCRLSARFPRPTLALVRLLREANSDGVPVGWSGEIDDDIDAGLLVHLPPPDPTTGRHADAVLTEWRQRYQPGLCYYRLGPDFVFIKDTRRIGASARFRLEGAVPAFRRLETLVDVAALDPETRRVMEDLERERLVLRLGGLATLLPSRMRRWPVPALEV